MDKTPTVTGKMTRREALLGLGIFLAAATVGAGASPALADDERRRRWRALSPEERTRVLANYRRFKSLPPDDRERLVKRWRRWCDMSEERRDTLRENARRLRAMDDAERERYVHRLRRFRAYPEDRQDRMRCRMDRLRSMEARQRREFREKLSRWRDLSAHERRRVTLVIEGEGPGGVMRGRLVTPPGNYCSPPPNPAR